MRTLRRSLVALILLVLVVAVGGYWYERPLLLTGTGYAAHNACALDEIAGRSDPADDLPPNPLVPILRTKQTDDGATKGMLVGGLAAQRAYYTEGYGCTLADSALDLPAPAPVDGSGNPFTEEPAPTASPEVAAAVGQAFGDDLSAADREALGTRAVIVVKDGQLIGERYADGFDADTRQLGWSMTKSVTNLLVGRLVQEGAISLDDDHLRPEWTDERAAITVEQLLRMTSGLRWDETYDLGTPITRMLYLERDMGDYVASHPLAHDPGTYQQYSSGSTTMLCDILLASTDAGHGGRCRPASTGAVRPARALLVRRGARC